MSLADDVRGVAVEEPTSGIITREKTEATTTPVDSSLDGCDSPVRKEANPDSQPGASEAVRKGAGPRTKMGKERAKYNALKHGLFAKVVLLSHEPRAQFDALLLGLRNDLRPYGVLEDALVEKLATILWRYRRLLQAESAEVLKNMAERKAEEDKESELQEVEVAAMVKLMAQAFQHGIIEGIDNPSTLESCISELREESRAAGLLGINFFENPTYLGSIYGARCPGRPGKDLFDHFLECAREFKSSAIGMQWADRPTDGDSAQKYLAGLDKEIHRLEGLRKQPVPERKPTRATKKFKPTGIALLKSVIPDDSGMDRLLRYEAAVERAIDRTLRQLAWAQKIRSGQQTIDLTHSNR